MLSESASLGGEPLPLAKPNLMLCCHKLRPFITPKSKDLIGQASDLKGCIGLGGQAGSVAALVLELYIIYSASLPNVLYWGQLELKTEPIMVNALILLANIIVTCIGLIACARGCYAARQAKKVGGIEEATKNAAQLASLKRAMEFINSRIASWSRTDLPGQADLNELDNLAASGNLGAPKPRGKTTTERMPRKRGG